MQLSQLATWVGEREKGTFPSQPVPNPRGQAQNPNQGQVHVIQDD